MKLDLTGFRDAKTKHQHHFVCSEEKKEKYNDRLVCPQSIALLQQLEITLTEANAQQLISRPSVPSVPAVPAMPSAASASSAAPSGLSCCASWRNACSSRT